MKRFAITLLLLASGAAFAETHYVTIPGEGWTLRLDAPPLTSTKASTKGRAFKHVATSVESGITVSVHIAVDGSRDSRECFDTFWAKALTSPVLVKSSVATFEDETAFYATHRSEGEYKGEAFKTANGHAYFVEKGLCVDVHVSHWPFTENSEVLVRASLESIEVLEQAPVSCSAAFARQALPGDRIRPRPRRVTMRGCRGLRSGLIGRATCSLPFAMAEKSGSMNPQDRRQDAFG